MMSISLRRKYSIALEQFVYFLGFRISLPSNRESVSLIKEYYDVDSNVPEIGNKRTFEW